MSTATVSSSSGGARPNTGRIAFAQVVVRAHRGRHLRDVVPHLARVDQRPQALCPQVVVRAVPAVPALAADVVQRRRVAVDAHSPLRARHAVGECAPGAMARRARDRAAGGEPRVREQPRAECDGLGLGRHAVGRVDDARRRPRSQRHDAADFGVGERHRCRRLREGRSDRRGGSNQRESSRTDCADHARSRFVLRCLPAGCAVPLTPSLSPQAGRGCEGREWGRWDLRKRGRARRAGEGALASPRKRGEGARRAGEGSCTNHAHSTRSVDVSRCVVLPATTSNVTSQRPGMWNSRPSPR